MTGVGWQDLVAVGAVVAALLYLVRRRRAKPKPTLVGLGRAPRRGSGPPA